MDRRSLLKFIGLGAVAGPKTAEAAILDAKSTIGFAMPSDASDVPFAENYIHKAEETLALRLLPGAKERYKFDTDLYASSNLDPQIASLRSVSLVNKMRMTKEYVHEKRWEREGIDIERILTGAWRPRRDRY